MGVLGETEAKNPVRQHMTVVVLKLWSLDWQYQLGGSTEIFWFNKSSKGL